MFDIIVHEGEYEYLIENDPNFRKFVIQCEGLNTREILELVTKIDTKHEEC